MTKPKATPKPRLKKMTAKEHAKLVAGGCDPHCHACHKKINVGDQWALKVFITGHSSPTLSSLALFEVNTNIRGSCCAACVAEDRGLPPEEIVEFERRMAAWAERMSFADMPAKKRPPSQVVQPSSRGCFVLPDGTQI